MSLLRSYRRYLFDRGHTTTQKEGYRWGMQCWGGGGYVHSLHPVEQFEQHWIWLASFQMLVRQRWLGCWRWRWKHGWSLLCERIKEFIIRLQLFSLRRRDHSGWELPKSLGIARWKLLYGRFYWGWRFATGILDIRGMNEKFVFPFYYS